MKVVLDDFEQSIEDNAEKFVPLSDKERAEVETIINATANNAGSENSVWRLRDEVCCG